MEGSRVAVRAARLGDLDRLLEIHLAAFPDPRSVEVRRRVFLHNRLGGLEHLRVAHYDGEIVGHAFSFPVGVWFGGNLVPGRAVASVGVAVESRGRGVASALMHAIHEEAKEDGVFTLLYPFRQGFYARQGYAPLARHRVLTLSPRAIPDAWAAAAPGVIRKAQARDREGIAAAYASAGRLGTGLVDRSPRVWENDLLEERVQWLLLEHAGAVHGYVSLRLVQTEPHARVRAVIEGPVSPHDATRRRLLAAVAALADQVSEVTLALADDDPLDWAFVDGDRDRGGTADVEHAQGVVNTSPMLRLVDPAAALSARGYARDGAVDLAIDDAVPFTLRIRGGVGQVTPNPDAPAEAVLRMSAATLASVAFGGLALADAVRLGWLAPSEPRVLDAAASLLQVPAFFSLDAF